MSTFTAPPLAPPHHASAPGCQRACPIPTPQHTWLRQLVGEWTTAIEIHMPLGQPPLRSCGRETIRMVGDFWLVSEGHNTAFDYTCRLTLGYDADRARYVGTWIDSLSGHLWLYDGEVDPTGQRLTLETAGPSPLSPNGTGRFRETTEILSPAERRFTSAQQGPDGAWVTLLTIHHQRVS